MSAFKLIELNYTDDLISHYSNFSDLPGFVLLESADRKIGRYDILSALPYHYLKVDRQESDPAQIYNLLKECLPQTDANLDLPFQGGAIGYFSYDFGAKLAGIDSPAQPGLETMPLVELGFYDWAIIADHHFKKINLVVANTQHETAKLIPELIARWQQIKSSSNTFNLKQTFSPLITKEKYQEAFKQIYQELQRGRSYQVNYTQPFQASYEGDPWEMYNQIRATNPVPYSAFLRSAHADILSFSPERFIEYENGVLLTSPIKGTEKRSADEKQDEFLRTKLAACAKNRAENIMIVDLMRNDLGKISKAGTVSVRDLCAVESYQAVHHLVSHIEGQCLEQISAIDAFGACFPGGSITGAPKLEAMRIIAEQEIYGRGLYCGSIGYFSNHGRFDTNIAIRTVLARDDTLYMAAGGGLVVDSDWEDEYQECFTKIAAIVNGFKNASL